MRVLLNICTLVICAYANLLTPAILKQTVELRQDLYQIMGFPQSALNQTEVQISLECDENAELEFEVQVVLRSSPCDKEFFDARNSNKLKHHLAFYFENDTHIPEGQDYTKIMWYKSQPMRYSCMNSHGKIFFKEDKSVPMEIRELLNGNRRKRETFPGLNGRTVDGGTKLSLSTWHPFQTVKVDAIYFLIMKINVVSMPKNAPEGKAYNLTAIVEWRAPHGFLSAIDYPLLRFYTLMCVVYAILALIWLYLCLKYFRDILQIQYWIGAVIILGMLEKAFFVSEYSTMNTSGMSSEGIIELAELVSCIKRTMSRVLVIIVSVGYGVVKPRLGKTLNQVAGLGLIYFVLCAVEGLARVSKNHVEAQKQKQLASLPLVIVEVIIFYWIYSSLGTTMSTLRIRRNEVKLNVYRHFTNTLVFAVLASVCFMVWSLMYHVFPSCLREWKGLWIDVAFWHVLFLSILIAIMFLWRPSQNNQRYAFTPLLDNSEDENDQDELFNSAAPGFDALTMRETGSYADARKAREQEKEERGLKEDLRWIEDHIPTNLTDQLVMDDTEEEEMKKFQISKML